MSFTIGRASLPVDPSSARWSGDQLTITGWISPTTANDTNHAYALRQQLLGLVNNPDEQVFPCTFSVDPNWDGYYYVNSVNIAGDPGLMEIQGRMPYTITLTRLANGFSRPQIEYLTLGALRTNVHGIATPVGIMAARSRPATYDNETAPLWTTSFTTDDGTVGVYAAAVPFAAATGRTFTKPADYYTAMCGIEIKYGSNWYRIVGRQLPPTPGTNWRLTNGYTRVYPTNVSGTGRFTVERYNGASWVGREFSTTATTTAQFSTSDTNGPLTIQVLNNAPEFVSLRTFYANSTFDFTLRSASPFLELAIGGTNTVQYGIKSSAVVACTAFTGGIRATANDANGLRPLISCPVATTTDLVNGIIYLSVSSATAAFQISPDYLTPGAYGTDTTHRDLFFAMRSERQSVVVR